jgi:hypothetical protein
MSTVIDIHPYKSNGMWVFDDPEVRFRQEPFVAGAVRSSNVWFKIFLTRSGALDCYFSTTRLQGFKLSLSGDAKSLAETGNTAQR